MLDQSNQHAFPLSPLNTITTLVERAGDLATLHVLGEVAYGDASLPIYVVTMGSDRPDVPVLGLFGGVHGVERIGTDVVLAYMHSLIEGLRWAPQLREQLQHMRLVFMPVVNPGGMLMGTRCNPNHVDLMRNAPIDATGPVPFLAGGQRLSRHLPWYRGEKDTQMEIEAQALCQVVEQFLLPYPFSLALDCHSGYGHKDYIWFPYAASPEPFTYLAEVQALKNLFDRTYPNHTYYQIEPQSLQYMTHGDLWDYLHMQSLKQPEKIFIPFTLEMGSWLWVKKNPRQLLRFTSLFNPETPHRHQRILRRHLVLIEFLLRAVQGYSHWLPEGAEKHQLSRDAMQTWYSQ